jgi:hypothetical protein
MNPRWVHYPAEITEACAYYMAKLGGNPTQLDMSLMIPADIRRARAEHARDMARGSA